MLKWVENRRKKLDQFWLSSLCIFVSAILGFAAFAEIQASRKESERAETLVREIFSKHSKFDDSLGAGIPTFHPVAMLHVELAILAGFSTPIEQDANLNRIHRPIPIPLGRAPPRLV